MQTESTAGNSWERELYSAVKFLPDNWQVTDAENDAITFPTSQTPFVDAYALGNILRKILEEYPLTPDQRNGLYEDIGAIEPRLEQDGEYFNMCLIRCAINQRLQPQSSNAV